MRAGLALLAWRHIQHHTGRTLLLVACLAVPIFLPWAASELVERYEDELGRRAADTPLVAGAKGSRFDLCLSALHFRRTGLAPIPYGEAKLLQSRGEGLAIPLELSHRVRGYPLVGTTPEYFELRDLTLAQGRPALRIGECVLGSDVARRLAVQPGARLHSDQEELYDISRPPALEMQVVGVLASSDGPDDGAVFADLKTAWVVAGHGHGHLDAESPELDPDLVLGRSETGVAISPALIEHESVSAQNVEDFHFHGDLEELPLSAILFVPKDDKSATLAKSRLGRTAGWQMIVPTEIVDELLSLVLRVKSLLDGFVVTLSLATLLLLGLVLLLSTRLREAEMLTLERIGAAPRVSLRLHGLEMGLVLAAATLLASLGVALTLFLVPDPASLFL